MNRKSVSHTLLYSNTSPTYGKMLDSVFNFLFYKDEREGGRTMCVTVICTALLHRHMARCLVLLNGWLVISSFLLYKDAGRRGGGVGGRDEMSHSFFTAVRYRHVMIDSVQ